MQFIVDTDGSIVEPQIVKKVDPYLDREALNVISIMPKWIPAEKNGQKVRARYTLPIIFKL